MSIVLPTKKVKKERVNPKRLIIYSKPKTGKTTAFAGLENNLILDLENGSGYVEALKVKIENLQDLLDAGKAIKEADKPYKYVTVDTVTALESMVMPLAVKLYRKTPMGKNYQGDNVITLANGAGYLYIRQAFFQVLDFIDTLAPHIILSGHIKDKVVDDKGEMVMSANIDLTGKIKSLICANADAIGYMYRKGNKTVINFKNNDGVTCGARPNHLRNEEIVISEMNEKGEIKTHWNKIYKS
tara:strand:+ start:19092 stop:19817 length:726 start_codon:yes stop_codon:yes gene_type:complete